MRYINNNKKNVYLVVVYTYTQLTSYKYIQYLSKSLFKIALKLNRSLNLIEHKKKIITFEIIKYIRNMVNKGNKSCMYRYTQVL